MSITRSEVYIGKSYVVLEILITFSFIATVLSERVSLYKEFNDAFKEYVAKRMTQEEYATICRIVTEGFVELSIEILALEAHLGGPAHVSTINALSSPTTTTATIDPSSSSSEQSPVNNSSRRNYSLDSPEHAQLIREVQLLEKHKLALTVQGQKYVLEKEAQEAHDIKHQEAELQADRVVGNDQEDEGAERIESEVQATAVHDIAGRTPSQSAAAANGSVKLTVEEWQVKLDENRDSLNEIVEEINDKLADIQEAIAVLVL
ncbi:hypothetical protein BGZ47_002535 [Haplosporangium gracile]|nr:hypothetical protein BGZ47_002535 [Haplosporangium gracile]